MNQFFYQPILSEKHLQWRSKVAPDSAGKDRAGSTRAKCIQRQIQSGGTLSHWWSSLGLGSSLYWHRCCSCLVQELLSHWRTCGASLRLEASCLCCFSHRASKINVIVFRNPQMKKRHREIQRNKKVFSEPNTSLDILSRKI